MGLIRRLRKSPPARDSAGLKYYVYVSDAKVDMLFAQIPADLRKRISAELKVDLKLVSVAVKDAPSDETRYSKLALVCDYIRTNLPVGTVDAPEDYFEGTLKMRWGPYGEPPHGSDRARVVYFGGETAQTVLGLGGSMAHVIGAPGTSATASASATPELIAALTTDLGGDVPLLDTDEARWVRRLQDMPRDEVEEGWAWCVGTATADMRGPAQNLEFLAKTLMRREGEEEVYKHPLAQKLLGDEAFPRKVLLGTPIYVAQN